MASEPANANIILVNRGQKSGERRTVTFAAFTLGMLGAYFYCGEELHNSGH